MDYKSRTLLISLPMIGVLIACELGPRKNFQSGSNTQNINEQELLVMINELLAEKEGEGDDNLKGFEESSTVKALENHVVVQSVLVRPENERDPALNSEEEQKLKEYQELLKSEEKAFDFEAPEGFVASFSQPVLFAADPEPEPIECDRLSYQTDEPSMNEIFDSAKDQGICGPIAAKFCIRLTLKGNSALSVHTESPSLNLTIPCADQSFIGLGLEIEDGDAYTRKDFVDITVNALISVSEVYLTNISDCSSGGKWQELGEGSLEWQLSWNKLKTEASVYAKFRDILGYESACVSDSGVYKS